MPYLLSYGQSQEMNRVIAHFWIPLVFSVLIFYGNYFFLIDKFLFPKKTALFVGINILLIGFFIFLREFSEDNFFQDLADIRVDSNGETTGPPLMILIYVQSISYMAPLLFSIAIKSTRRWVETETERKEAVTIKLQSELQHLRYQLQPHFFFNSLNNIYALVDISPDQAKSSIHSLSKLMRYMLYETNEDKVPLLKEIDFMKKYIDLMKLRVSAKTKVSCDFPSERTGIRIAPLLFISIIENAFKHGVSGSRECHIDLKMSCNDKTVSFTLENDNFPKKNNDKSGSGIGITNIKKRLNLLYPNKSHFRMEVNRNRFVSHLEIETE